MRNLLFSLALLMSVPAVAFALPGSSVYPKADKGYEFNPVPCAVCHKSNKQFEENVYVDVRDDSGASLVDDKGIAQISWAPGKTTTIQVVVGLKKQDTKAELAGWFVNLPLGASLARGSVNYCYQRINYETGVGMFSADEKPYLTTDTHHVTFHRYMKPQTTELWIGVGGKATETSPGSPERKGTLGLKTIKLNWVKSAF